MRIQQKSSKQPQLSNCTYQSSVPLLAGAPENIHHTAQWGKYEEGQTVLFPLKCTVA